MQNWEAKFAVSYFAALAVAAGLLFSFPHLNPLCGENASWLECHEQVNFLEFILTPSLPIFLLLFISISFVLTFIWPRRLSWPQTLTMGIVCGALVVLEIPSGLLFELDVHLETRFGSAASILLYIAFFCLPYVLSILSRFVLPSSAKLK
jgi:hypothetical protein